MSTNGIQSEVLSSEAHGIRRVKISRRPNVRRTLLLLHPHGDKVYAMLARRQTSGNKVVAIDLENEVDRRGIYKKLGKNGSIVAILPKSHYLIRHLELPKAQPDEIRQMVTLEVEAQLPPEFGEADIAYRQIASGADRAERYEAYAARRDQLQTFLNPLLESGLQVDYLLPSALIWDRLFAGGLSADLVMAEIGSGQFEAAVSGHAGHLASVRTFTAASSGGVAEVDLIDSIRPLLAQATSQKRALDVAWIGTGCPESSQGCVAFEDLASQSGSHDEKVNSINCFLKLVSTVLLGDATSETWQSVNLLPRIILAKRDQKAIRRMLVTIACCLVLAVMLTGTAMQIALIRYQVKSDALAVQIARIRAEGEAVGERIEQLQAVSSARATRHDFYAVLDGLYEASPDGVTYSQVELNKEGEIRLRGQADALSLPFLLPQQMEPMPMFMNVTLRDAGQTKRGEGTVVEFHAEAKLWRMKGDE